MNRLAIVVLGVGRSGTSALARVLNLRGAVLPREVLPPGPGNERGHWEPAWLAVMNHRILESLGCSYESAAPMPRGWMQTPQANHYVRLTADLLEQEYADADLIVIKEPRLCRLAPITFAALEMLGFSPRVVLAVRHPSEVVKSFAKRDGVVSEIAEMRWIRHMIESEAASRSHARVMVDFEEVLRDWRTLTWRIGARLQISWPIDAESAAPRIDGFLEPSLRHHDVGRNAADSDVGDLARRLWQAVRRGVGGDEVGLQAEFDVARLVIDEYDRLSGSVPAAWPRRPTVTRQGSAAG